MVLDSPFTDVLYGERMSETRKLRERGSNRGNVVRRSGHAQLRRLRARSAGAVTASDLPHRPIHPGRFLQSRFLLPLGISQSELAAALGVSRRRVNELLRGHRGITADTALRLGLYFAMDPHFWLGLQMAWELHLAAQRRTAAANPAS